jgi:alkaline phosphatase
MVKGFGAENNGYSLLDLFDDGTIRLTGFRKQSNYHRT